MPSESTPPSFSDASSAPSLPPPGGAKKPLHERWGFTAEELTRIVDENPSLRGMLFGYVAELKSKLSPSMSEEAQLDFAFLEGRIYQPMVTGNDQATAVPLLMRSMYQILQVTVNVGMATIPALPQNS